jgi:hypothetical protein
MFDVLVSLFHVFSTYYLAVFLLKIKISLATLAINQNMY